MKKKTFDLTKSLERNERLESRRERINDLAIELRALELTLDNLEDVYNEFLFIKHPRAASVTLVKILRMRQVHEGLKNTLKILNDAEGGIIV
jgi:hypothetical protein